MRSQLVWDVGMSALTRENQQPRRAHNTTAHSSRRQPTDMAEAATVEQGQN